jgi:hypothetical protein
LGGRATISFAGSVNIRLCGLIGPFAAGFPSTLTVLAGLTALGALLSGLGVLCTTGSGAS